MAPEIYRDARMEARHHILGEIVGRSDCRIAIKVRRAFRGNLALGKVLMLEISVLPDGPVPLGGTLYVRRSIVDRARYVEAFLDGEPPEIVREQIKFFTQTEWELSGDPSKVGVLW